MSKRRANTPRTATSPRNAHGRHHLFPSFAADDGNALEVVLEQLEQSQWQRPEQIQQRQWEQFSLLFDVLRTRSEFYKRRFRQAGMTKATDITSENWRRLPILTRQQLQSGTDTIKLAKPPAGHRRLGMAMTSGSTGTPVRVATTDSTRLLWQAFVMREHLWQQRDFSARLGAIRHFGGEVEARYPHGVQLADWGPPVNRLYRSGPGMALDIHTDPAQQLEWLRRCRPGYLVTFPSNAAAIAALSLQDGAGMPGLKGVRLLSEPVDEVLRESIRTAWGVGVSDSYSAQETGALAIQCPEFPHYHVQSENVLLEVVDDECRPCRPGEVGRVLVSTLHNFAMPLLRYEIGDFAEVGEPCPCGRGLPVLRRILGRVRNMLTLPDGSRHWPSLAATFYREVAPVIQHQLVQHDVNDIEARLGVERPLTAGEEGLLRDMIAARLGYPFAVRISFCDTIERSTAGKFEEFLSLVDRQSLPPGE